MDDLPLDPSMMPTIKPEPKPEGTLVHGMRRDRSVPVSPRAEASVQRFLGNPQQIAWDRELDAKLMMSFVAGSFSQVPPSKIVGLFQIAVARLVGGFGRVDVVRHVFPVAAKKLRAGDAEGAQAAFVGTGGIVNAAAAVCDVIRQCFPLAPNGYGVRGCRPTK